MSLLSGGTGTPWTFFRQLSRSCAQAPPRLSSCCRLSSMTAGSRPLSSASRRILARWSSLSKACEMISFRSGGRSGCLSSSGPAGRGSSACPIGTTPRGASLSGPCLAPSRARQASFSGARSGLAPVLRGQALLLLDQQPGELLARHLAQRQERLGALDPGDLPDLLEHQRLEVAVVAQPDPGQQVHRPGYHG